MAENASDQAAGTQVADAKAADAAAPVDIDALMAEAHAEQQTLRAEGLEREVQSVIDASNAQGEDLKGTYSELGEDGKTVTYDLTGKVVSEGEHPAAGQPKDPADAPKDDAKPETATEAQAPADDAKQADAPDEVKDPKPEDSHSAHEHVLAQLRAENARLRALQSPTMADVKPDLSNEPDWEDGTKFPTPEAAAKARADWYQERYQAAAKAVLDAHTARVREEVGRVAQAGVEAEGQRIHDQVRTRLGLDEASYRAKVAQLGSVTHPQWNDRFRVRNPVGHLLTQAKSEHAQNMAAAGVDAKGHDTVADVHEAQLRDHDLAVKVASLPISHEAAALVQAVARQPRTVALLKHFTSDAGRADADRLLRPNTPPQIVDAEVYRIAASLPADTGTKVEGAPAGLQGVPKQPAPTLPVPGRSQPSRAAVSETLETPEGQDALFRRLQAEADKSGANGWRTM